MPTSTDDRDPRLFGGPRENDIIAISSKYKTIAPLLLCFVFSDTHKRRTKNPQFTIMSSLLAKSRGSLRAATITTTSKMCRPAVCHYTGGATRHGNDPEADILHPIHACVCGAVLTVHVQKVIEKGKQSVLRKHRKDSTEAPHWHEELASDAEAFVFLPLSLPFTHTHVYMLTLFQVKAQRGEIEASEETIVKLQNDSATKARKEMSM